MSLIAEEARASRSDGLLKELPHSAHQHFTLYFYAAMLRVLEHVTLHFGSADAAHERLPFLGGYLEQIAGLGLHDLSFGEAHAEWLNAIERWESNATCRLPLRELRLATGLTHEDVTVLLQIGLAEEDPRIGFVYDALQGGNGEQRPTRGLLAAGWQNTATDAHRAIRLLEAFGLVESARDGSSALQVCASVWDAVRGTGAVTACGWLRHQPPETLPLLNTLILPGQLQQECALLPQMLAAGAVTTVILRGPRHNGRSSLAAALAREIGKGLLTAHIDGAADDVRWRTAASLACLLNAALLTTADLGPAEAMQLPDLPGRLAPFFVTVGPYGSITGPLADRARTIRLPVPDRAARIALWQSVFGEQSDGLPFLRMTSGNIVRAAAAARAQAPRVSNIDGVTLRAAVRTLQRPGIDALARRIEASGDWSQLAVAPETRAELQTLEARCRHREQLPAFTGTALRDLGPGVRALFKGPSGTGKSLAARLLAAALGMDLYRLDLGSVVNKYIGETEKNLERVFACAEELDVILLLDEGDALLTHRTGVQTANDRYANLETNYLLQRLESYDGILLVTTNAAERIDHAFQRRMDVVIDFGLPDISERWQIWQLHLPAQHRIDAGLLNSAAQRCALSGGQIRNIALHASLLALEGGTLLESRHLEAAIEREYRKHGGVSPLRVRNGAR